jgi:hypothetical protein
MFMVITHYPQPVPDPPPKGERRRRVCRREESRLILDFESAFDEPRADSQSRTIVAVGLNAIASRCRAPKPAELHGNPTQQQS